MASWTPPEQLQVGTVPVVVPTLALLRVTARRIHPRIGDADTQVGITGRAGLGVHVVGRLGGGFHVFGADVDDAPVAGDVEAVDDLGRVFTAEPVWNLGRLLLLGRIRCPEVERRPSRLLIGPNHRFQEQVRLKIGLFREALQGTARAGQLDTAVIGQLARRVVGVFDEVGATTNRTGARGERSVTKVASSLSLYER